ncbi:MAG: winged helix-turn-helix domain-containing protein [Rickettsiales bacterium]|nr:winged helix-turn-helix domain-containing protein [Rickettsiales bacterium]
MKNITIKISGKNSVQKQAIVDLIINNRLIENFRFSDTNYDLQIVVENSQIILQSAGKIKFADIILKKPVLANEMIEKIQHIISSSKKELANILQIKNAMIDVKNQTITLKNIDKKINLTEKEIQILTALYDAENHVIDKKELLECVWGYSDKIDTHTLESHIYKLRQKIEKDATNPQIILTEKNAYKLVV